MKSGRRSSGRHVELVKSNVLVFSEGEEAMLRSLASPGAWLWDFTWQGANTSLRKGTY